MPLIIPFTVLDNGTTNHQELPSLQGRWIHSLQGDASRSWKGRVSLQSWPFGRLSGSMAAEADKSNPNERSMSLMIVDDVVKHILTRRDTI